MNAGIENSANKAEEELINKSSLIMEIGEEELTYIDGTKYNTLILKPYKSELIEVVQLMMMKHCLSSRQTDTSP